MSTMSTTAVIQVDLQIPSISMIYAKQFDSLSRFADIRMLSGGQPWNAGTSVTYAVQYSKADGTKGMYDKLPDGITNAVTAETDDSGGTVLRVRFAPQMFTVPGKVKCSIAMIQSDGTKLQTFSIYVVVEESEVNGDASEDYYKMTTLDDLMKAINSVNSSLTSLSKKAVKSVNGVQPDTAGNVEVAAGGLQIVRAVHGSDDVYTATGDALPLVVPGYTGQHTGKGAQIVFIPGGENTTAAPKLQLNGGSKVQIRMRAPRNQWDNSQSPDATLPVPVGAMMNGVPYTMTFCGYFWLIDSNIERFSSRESEYLKKQAEAMNHMTDLAGNTMPVFEVNGDGTPESVSARKAAVISATDAESEETFLELPTVKKVKEMLTADAAPLYITLSYNTDAAKWFPDVNYTASDIIAALSARQVVVKVIVNEHTTLYAPVTQYVSIGSDKRIVFGAISYSDPTDLTMYWFISATCYDSGAWDVVLDDQN